MDQPTSNRVAIIKNIYFYLVSFVALMMVVFSLADLINLGLKTWVFTKADNFGYYNPDCSLMMPLDKRPSTTSSEVSKEQCEKQQEQQQKSENENRIAQRQRDAVRDVSMIVVGLPLFILHWRIVRRKEE